MISNRRFITYCRSDVQSKGIRRKFARFVSPRSSIPETKLLGEYWSSRGIWSEETRKRLIEMAMQQPNDQEKDNTPIPIQNLPGLPSATWMIEGVGRSEVLEVSRRLIRLNELLGRSCDVPWMVTREPDLLTADFNLIIQRLMQMRAMSSGNVDVLNVVGRQPSLLLNDKEWLSFSLQQESSDGSMSGEERSGEMIRSWEAGIVSDTDREWGEKYLEMKSYWTRTGDTHVGFGREIDNPSLARWVAKQRSDFKRGEISDQRRSLLEHLGFEWDEADAEFMRWHAELSRYKDAHGHSNPNPLSAGDDHYLINWCGLQRIALRCRVLSKRREKLLDELAFDWTGADPLS